MSEPLTSAGDAPAPVFAERPTEFVVRDAWVLGAVPLALAGLCGLAGWNAAGYASMALVVFVAFFFRNPPRELPDDESAAVAPADGRVVAVGEVERPDGSKALRIGIFLSIFDVHVNRAPLAGRVVEVVRGGSKFLAAFNPKAESENVRCALRLETESGERFDIVQITGLIARRIVCHPQPGEWLARGVRYGLIRFGSRTDVWLPLSFEARVKPGDKVRGGADVLAAARGQA